MPRFELSSIATPSGRNWAFNGTDTIVPFDEPARLSLTLLENDQFTGSLSNDSVAFFTLATPMLGTPNTPITSLRFQNIGTGSSIDGATELFIDQIKVSQVVPEPASGGMALWNIVALLGYLRRSRV